MKIPLLAALMLLATLPARAADFTWIESQNTSAINVVKSDDLKVEVAGWGHKELLSGESWFQIGADEDKVEKAVPAAGITLDYRFETAENGPHQIWNRIGYEFARSPFDWRVDSGDWTRVAPDELTSDLMPLAEWTEVAWLQLGAPALKPGAHTLQIRLPREKNGDKWARVLYASDAIVISRAPFAPDGPNQPGALAPAQLPVYELPAPDANAPNSRAEIALKGDWQICRDDEQAPADVAAPIKQLPAAPIWKTIAVPGDKAVNLPQFGLAHRVWYRAQVNVPDSQSGKSYFLDFPLNNLNTTVYVNGQLCGFFPTPFARFQIDCTQAIRPGANEIWVGIRDAYYGFTPKPGDPMKLRRQWNFPLTKWNQGFLDLDYPVWNCPQSGLLNTPTFVAAGRVYASDVFVKPDVEHKQLAAQITLSNPSATAIAGEIRVSALDENGALAKTFSVAPFRVAAGQTAVVNWKNAWADAQLWWPDAPKLYDLRVQLVADGQVVDQSETRFGFRQWTTRGQKYLLNGVVWHLWAELVQNGSKEQWLADYRAKNQRTYRFVTAGQAGSDAHFWKGLETQAALSWMDAQGVTVRRNSTLDGEVIGYKFSEDDADIVKAQGGSKIKVELMKNWRAQCVAQARGERNHASIQIWSIENEFAYINLLNLLGNSPEMDAYEREEIATANAVMAIDPTRSVMIDGGGATKFQALPTHGDHYVWSANDARYPDLAYENYPTGGGRGRWEWDETRPRFLGEDFYATGVNPADYAMWGGEAAFGGKAQAKPAVGRVYRMLQEGYRWGAHYAAWHFWIGEETASGQYGANAPRAAFCRQWNWSFGAGEKVARTWGIFNDSHDAAPLIFTRALLVGGKTVWRQVSTHAVAPGTNFKFDEAVPMPDVSARTDAQMVLKLEVGGREIFRDSKDVAILPDAFAAGKTGQSPQLKPAAAVTRAGAQLKPASAGLALYDPKNAVAPFLTAHQVAFSRLDSLENLPAVKTLLIGPDALSPAQSTSSRLAAWASSGRALLVLEQKNPLHFQGLPAAMTLATQTQNGSAAFVEDASSPALKGLRDADFFQWNGGVYRDAYAKPARGARSLVQAGARLGNSVLTEVPTGTGVILLCQLNVGGSLQENAVARLLLANLLDYGRAYKQEFRAVIVASDDAQLLKALDGTGVQYERGDLIDSLSGNRIVIAQATPENLAKLNANRARLDAFNNGGGYLMLHGLAPAGLESFDELVGFKHMIRPFGRERVGFAARRDPLMVGVNLGDLVMLSGQRIFGYTSDEYVASDVFSNVVDYEDVAPFARSDFAAFPNITNGFTGADGWPLIINFELPKSAAGALEPFTVKMNLPQPQTLDKLVWTGNTFYYPQTQIQLSFDGKPAQNFAVAPNGEPQVLEFAPTRVEKEIALTIAGWQVKNDSKPLVGIDNISLLARRAPEFYERVKPLDSVGGLMRYPRGAGGIVLNNLLYKDAEAVPANAVKKRAITAAILRNLKAPFAGGPQILVGQNLDYTPVDIGAKATMFRNERGWFGDPNQTFAALPTGRQTFAGVPFEIYDFPTSPVPTAVGVGGDNVPGNLPDAVRGIAVKRRADALFFLQTARVDKRPNDDERKKGVSFEVGRYVVHYADGTQEIIPIVAEKDVENWKQKTPVALPGAQLAWTAPLPATDETAVAYFQQWDNPKPGVEIASVDLEKGEGGAPVLLALTAASG